MAVRWPDFYIVGAPKAGTTSLYEYLAGHPDIFLPERKELRYFGSDLAHRRRHELSEAEFLDHYAGAPPERQWGNAYVWYLYSRSAAAEIHAVRPDARIVVMLRDPVRALYALHSEFVFDGNEDIDDFSAALAAEPDRCAGRRIPAEAHFPEALCYHRTVAYGEQLARYLDLFGRDQVHVALIDDFIADADAAAGRVLAFLGLQPADRSGVPARQSEQAVAIGRHAQAPGRATAAAARRHPCHGAGRAAPGRVSAGERPQRSGPGPGGDARGRGTPSAP